MRRALLLLMSDSHGGHKLGLLSPGVKLYDEREDGAVVEFTPQLTAIQEWLWFDVYLPAVDQAARLANGAPIVALHGGDMCHGDGHPEQLISTQMASQVQIAVANMAPIMALNGLAALRLVFGTGVHEFGEGSAALLVSAQLRLMHPGTDVKVMYHALSEVAGANIDYAHHGPGVGSRDWLRGNNARYYLRDVMLQELLAGRRPPEILWRAHVHDYVHEILIQQMANGQEATTHMFITPAMCGLGDYGRKATKSEFILRNGLVAVLVENGRVVDAWPLIQTVDLRTKETIL